MNSEELNINKLPWLWNALNLLGNCLTLPPLGEKRKQVINKRQEYFKGMELDSFEHTYRFTLSIISNDELFLYEIIGLKHS